MIVARGGFHHCMSCFTTTSSNPHERSSECFEAGVNPEVVFCCIMLIYCNVLLHHRCSKLQQMQQRHGDTARAPGRD